MNPLLKWEHCPVPGTSHWQCECFLKLAIVLNVRGRPKQSCSQETGPNQSKSFSRFVFMLIMSRRWRWWIFFHLPYFWFAETHAQTPTHTHTHPRTHTHTHTDTHTHTHTHTHTQTHTHTHTQRDKWRGSMSSNDDIVIDNSCSFIAVVTEVTQGNHFSDCNIWRIM